MITVLLQKREVSKMINVDILAIEKLLEFVKEGNEVHMEYEPDRTVIEIMPWKPITYDCPFKRGDKDETD